jgi:uncharacterized protein (DUF342 family)
MMSVPRPNFTLRIDVFHHDAGDDVLPAIKTALDIIEAHMASFEEKLARLETSVTAWNERELKEDEDTVLTKSENTKLKKELADLQALHDAQKATPEQEARFEALLKQIDESNKISSEVIPEPTPTPEPPPELPVEEE